MRATEYIPKNSYLLALKSVSGDKSSMESEEPTDKKKHKDKFWLLKIITILVLAVFYDIWPFDLIPDIPIIGWGDDLIVTLASLYYAYKKNKEVS